MCVSTLAKCVLIIINQLVFLLGAAMFAIGAILRWGGAAMNDYISPAMDKLIAGSSAAGGDDTALKMTDIKELMGSYMEFLGSADIIFMCMGVFIAAVAVVGIVGACCEIKIILIVYCIVNGAILLVLLACLFAMVHYKTNLKDLGEKAMKTYLEEKYEGMKNAAKPPSASIVLDLIQARLECCGITNHTDFMSSARVWAKNRTYVLPNTTKIDIVIPVTCCKLKSTTFEPKNYTCLTAPTTTNANIGEGCYDTLWKLVDKYSGYVLYGLIGMSIFLAGLLVLSIILLCQLKI